jgi:hypothetical protein
MNDHLTQAARYQAQELGEDGAPAAEARQAADAARRDRDEPRAAAARKGERAAPRRRRSHA